MPVIKDPIHNPHYNGQYGVAWCEPVEGYPEGYLAVYNKKEHPQMMRLTSGWYFEGNVQDLKKPFKWCGVTISREIVTPININPPGKPGIPAQGPIAPQTLDWIGGNNNFNRDNPANAVWFTPSNLEPPNGPIIYPLP